MDFELVDDLHERGLVSDGRSEIADVVVDRIIVYDSERRRSMFLTRKPLTEQTSLRLRSSSRLNLSLTQLPPQEEHLVLVTFLDPRLQRLNGFYEYQRGTTPPSLERLPDPEIPLLITTINQGGSQEKWFYSPNLSEHYQQLCFFEIPIPPPNPVTDSATKTSTPMSTRPNKKKTQCCPIQ